MEGQVRQFPVILPKQQPSEETTTTLEPNTETVQCLEELLALAKTGELQAFVGVGMKQVENGKAMMFVEAGPIGSSVYGFIGALDILKTIVMKDFISIGQE